MKHLRPKTVRQLSRKVRSRARAPLAKEDTSGLKRLNEIREIMKIVCFCETRKSAVNETEVTTTVGNSTQLFWILSTNWLMPRLFHGSQITGDGTCPSRRSHRWIPKPVCRFTHWKPFSIERAVDGFVVKLLVTEEVVESFPLKVRSVVVGNSRVWETYSLALGDTFASLALPELRP